MKELIQEQSALEILKDHLPNIRAVMIDSLNQLNKMFCAIDVRINNRAKASTLHSIAVEKTKKILAEHPDIHIVEKYQSIQIIFKRQIVARIKKVNKNNISTNTSTWRNSQIESQQLKLFSMPEMTFVDLGYNIDPTWTSFEKLVVVCRVNEDVKWNIPFDESNVDVTISAQPIKVTPKETQIKIKKSNG